MGTLDEVIKQNIHEDVKELEAYRDWYVTCAALARDIEEEQESAAYASAAVSLEQCIQTIRCIPVLRKKK